MPYSPPVVCYYDTPTATWLTMSGVQSINCSRGRQRFQDPLSQSSAVIEIIPTATTTFSVGQYVEVKDANDDGISPCYFQGRITDVQRSYAFPYDAASGVTPADRMTISAAGAIGVAGARTVDGTIWSNVDAGTVVGVLMSAQSLISSATYLNGVKASSQSYSGPLLAAVNALLNTAQLTIDDYTNSRFGMITNNQLKFTLFPTGQQFNSIAFSDTGSNYKYTALNYLSSVQNTFNEIEVNATGFASQITQGTAPFNTLAYQTYNQNATEALNLSAYLYALLSGQTTPLPYTISTDTNAAPTCKVLAEITDETTLANAVIGQPVSVAFRGTSATGTVIGVRSNFYPAYASVQLHLSPSLGTPFTLDSTAFGILGGTGIIYNTPMDYNETGYIYNDDTADNGNRLGYP